MSLDERDYMQDRAHERFYGKKIKPRGDRAAAEKESFSSEWRKIGFAVLIIIIGAYLVKKLGLLALIFR